VTGGTHVELLSAFFDVNQLADSRIRQRNKFYWAVVEAGNGISVRVELEFIAQEVVDHSQWFPGEKEALSRGVSDSFGR
jgi:hypothetical protein